VLTSRDALVSVGLNELSENGVTQKILCFLTDRTLAPSTDPLRHVRTSRFLLYVVPPLGRLGAFGETFAITQTTASRWATKTSNQPGLTDVLPCGRGQPR
jgi:hypothetical protein